MKTRKLSADDLKHWDALCKGAKESLRMTLTLQYGEWTVLDGSGVKVANAYISGFLDALKPTSTTDEEQTKVNRYPSASGKRNLKDLYDQQEIGHEMCRDVLSLVGEEADESWTEEQRRHAANWAMRIYMRAGDNPIEQLAKPDFITLKGGMARTST